MRLIIDVEGFKNISVLNRLMKRLEERKLNNKHKKKRILKKVNICDGGDGLTDTILGNTIMYNMLKYTSGDEYNEHLMNLFERAGICELLVAYVETIKVAHKGMIIDPCDYESEEGDYDREGE